MARRVARTAGAEEPPISPDICKQGMSIEQQNGEMQGICANHGLPLSPAFMKKFHLFHREVIARLEYQSPHITGMYMRAMIYIHCGTARPKREFLKGFNMAVFDRAIKKVREWLDQKGREKEAVSKATGEIVCNLYSMLH